ncbi:ABC transporter permease [Georgenia alba]|uniref:ABC transporter permease n=1 Tax=Georgenia alba TaxID=2233858 RepID=A0ABW2QA70_9MICO
MTTYLVRRLLISIPVLLGVTVLNFAIIQLAPGSPADLYLDPNAGPDYRERVEAALGLDQPVLVQYWNWLSQLARGDLGLSYVSRTPVADVLAERIGPTLLLMGLSLVVAYAIAIPVGILAAKKKGTWVDYTVVGGAFFGVSVPNFFLGLALIYIFSLQLGWLPTGNMVTIGGGGGGLVDRILHLILPVTVLSTAIAGNMVRYVRASMVDALSEDYIRTAHAKGLAPKVVTNKHALRNALIPIVTILTVDLAGLLGGAIVSEQVFQWPGLGLLTIQSISSRDYSVLMGINLVAALAVFTANILADILYAVVDPRIEYR